MTREALPGTPPRATLSRELMRCSARLQQWTRFLSADDNGPLTGRQGRLLAVLGAACRTGSLAADLGVTPSVVSNMIKLLEEQKLVRRAIRRGDHKVWVFELSKAGTAARDQLVNRQLATVKAALSSLSAAELVTVAETLVMLGRLFESDEAQIEIRLREDATC